MPYVQAHQHLPIRNPGRSIWRYVKAFKFWDLVENRHLYFTQLRALVDLEMDVMEGSLAPANFDHPELNSAWFYSRIGYPQPGNHMSEAVRRQFETRTELERVQNWCRDYAYASSWFMNEFESLTMWERFADEADAVCILSSPARLQASVAAALVSVFIQPVKYFDPGAGQIVEPGEFEVPLHKHVRHHDEHELRGYLLAPRIDVTLKFDAHDRGVWVPCDPRTLIAKIRCSPRSTDAERRGIQERLAAAGLGHVAVEASRV